MKTYGETREAAGQGDYLTDANGWKGKQSRKVARKRKKDKKMLHRIARRTAKHSKGDE